VEFWVVLLKSLQLFKDLLLFPLFPSIGSSVLTRYATALALNYHLTLFTLTCDQPFFSGGGMIRNTWAKNSETFYRIIAYTTLVVCKKFSMYNFNNQWIREESDWFAYFDESDRRNCIALFCRFSHASVKLAIFRRQIALPQFKVIQLVRFTKRKPQSLLRTLRAIY